MTILTSWSCKKENAPSPSNLDLNYFVIQDNPNDPIDHAIYAFYKSTGIASFYKDSIYKRKISHDNETPERFSYVTLSLNYTPFGSSYILHEPLSTRNNVQALLEIIEHKVVPKLPSKSIIPSILLVDSFFIAYPIVDIPIEHGWTSIYGFNTVGVAVKDVASMNAKEKDVYAASILAGIAEKKINERSKEQLQHDFLSVTRNATKNLMSTDIYTALPYLLVLPENQIPSPTSIGLLFHTAFDVGGFTLPSMPRESDDIRGYLTAVFCYTNAAFEARHPNETLVLKKFSIMKRIVQESGFITPE